MMTVAMKVVLICLGYRLAEMSANQMMMDSQMAED